MQFMILAYDGTDPDAGNRRLAVREQHLSGAREMYRQGKLLYAAAVLNEDGGIAGSLMICEFPSHREMEEQWLRQEPYITARVWDRIEIRPVKVPPFIRED